MFASITNGGLLDPLDGVVILCLQNEYSTTFIHYYLYIVIVLW